MLFGVCLDIKYASDLSEQFVHDLEIELKEARANKRKTAKLFEKAKGQYEKVYGDLPKLNN